MKTAPGQYQKWYDWHVAIASGLIITMAVGGLFFLLFGPPLPTISDDLHQLRAIFVGH
jgi:hypothetical protein